MLDKTVALHEALAGIQNGATIMFGGFGSPGAPHTLIDALLRLGRRNLTVIKNEANEPGIGVSVS